MTTNLKVCGIKTEISNYVNERKEWREKINQFLYNYSV